MSAAKSPQHNNGSVMTPNGSSIRTRSNPRWNVIELKRDGDEARDDSGPAEEQGQERAAMSEHDDYYQSNMDRKRPPAIRICENDLNDLVELRVSK